MDDARARRPRRMGETRFPPALEREASGLDRSRAAVRAHGGLLRGCAKSARGSRGLCDEGSPLDGGRALAPRNRERDDERADEAPACSRPGAPGAVGENVADAWVAHAAKPEAYRWTF